MKRKTVIGATLVAAALICWLLWPSETLTDELVAQITPGMTLGELKKLLGEPIDWDRYVTKIEAVQETKETIHFTQRCQPVDSGLPTILLPKTQSRTIVHSLVYYLPTATSQDWLGRSRVLHVRFQDGLVKDYEIRPAIIKNAIHAWLELKCRDWIGPLN